MSTPSNIVERLEYLRGELRSEIISYGELAELQGLARYIEPGDVELLEAAGVPESSAKSVRVIFRKQKSGQFKGDITAVFPDDMWTSSTFTCYAHVGQHGGCSWAWWHEDTVPASPTEYAELLAELTDIYTSGGGTLKVVRKR